MPRIEDLGTPYEVALNDVRALVRPDGADFEVVNSTKRQVSSVVPSTAKSNDRRKAPDRFISPGRPEIRCRTSVPWRNPRTCRRKAGSNLMKIAAGALCSAAFNWSGVNSLMRSPRDDGA